MAPARRLESHRFGVNAQVVSGRVLIFCGVALAIVFFAAAIKVVIWISLEPAGDSFCERTAQSTQELYRCMDIVSSQSAARNALDELFLAAFGVALAFGGWFWAGRARGARHPRDVLATSAPLTWRLVSLAGITACLLWALLLPYHLGREPWIGILVLLFLLAATRLAVRQWRDRVRATSSWRGRHSLAWSASINALAVITIIWTVGGLLLGIGDRTAAVIILLVLIVLLASALMGWRLQTRRQP